MADTVPLTSARKRAPSSTLDESLLDAVTGVVVPRMVQGHEPGGGGAAAVVNVHEAGAMVLPAVSLAAETVRVWAGPGGHAGAGVIGGVRGGGGQAVRAGIGPARPPWPHAGVARR